MADNDQTTVPFPNPGNAPTAPVAGQATSPFDPSLASLLQQVVSLPQYQQATGQLSSLYGQEGDIARQQSELAANPPQTRWHPQYEPITGVGSALKDVGKGLLQGLSFTGPGQSVQHSIYNPGVQDWLHRRQALADQLSTLKGQEAIPAEQQRSMAQLGGLASLNQYRGLEAEDRQRRTAAYTQNVQNRYQQAMRGLDLRAALQGDQKALMEARTRLASIQADIAPEKLQLEQYGIDTNNATRQAVANVLASSGIGKEYATSNFIDNLLGTSLTPVAPQTPGGPTPTGAPVPKRGAPKPQANAGGGGMIYARDPQGQLHQAQKGTKLPQGWTMEQSK